MLSRKTEAISEPLRDVEDLTSEREAPDDEESSEQHDQEMEPEVSPPMEAPKGTPLRPGNRSQNEGFETFSFPERSPL